MVVSGSGTIYLACVCVSGVVLALKVPQLAVRRQNLMSAVESLTTIASLHQTQPTIQVLLARQEFAGALDLIATSQDIIKVGMSR